jgi:hypothetical protein
VTWYNATDFARTGTATTADVGISPLATLACGEVGEVGATTTYVFAAAASGNTVAVLGSDDGFTTPTITTTDSVVLTGISAPILAMAVADFFGDGDTTRALVVLTEDAISLFLLNSSDLIADLASREARVIPHGGGALSPVAPASLIIGYFSVADSGMLPRQVAYSVQEAKALEKNIRIVQVNAEFLQVERCRLTTIKNRVESA